jgi:Family of unknown function (DUF5317)
MWLALIAVVGGGLCGLAAGGRLSNVVNAPLRDLWLLVAGGTLEWAGGRWGLALVIIGYVLLLAFALRNIRLTGMLMIAFGLLSNLVVIAVDGGMPVRGVPPGISLGAPHHGQEPRDRLTGLADELRIGSLGETVSAGDLVLAVGAGAVAFSVIRPTRRRAPATPR